MEDKIPYIKRGRPTKKPSKEEFAKLYGNKSTKEIAEMYKTTPAVVRVWASNFRKDDSERKEG